MSSEKSTPKIRFKGFTDPWEQRKLKELGETYNGLTGKSKNDFGHGDAFYIPYLNIFTNSIVDNTNLEEIDIDSKQHTVNFGDVLFTVSSETPEDVGMTSIYMGNKNNLYLNSFCFGYRLNQRFDLFFLSSYFRSNVFRKDIEILAQGISRYNISKNKVMSLKISIPTGDEQSNIGCLLNYLDKTIAANQRKLEELKNLKKLLMQKMFSQEWRFKGFTDPWEQRKLNRISLEQFGGGTPSTSNSEFWNGKIPWIQSSNLSVNDINNIHVKKYINQKAVENTSVKEIPANSIAVVSRVGVGKLAVVPFKFTTSQDFISLGSIQEDVSFIAYYLYTKLLNWSTQGTSIKGMTKGDLLSMNLNIPKQIQEEEYISKTLALLDYSIAANQRKLDQLKELKKYLMQNMFI